MRFQNGLIGVHNIFIRCMILIVSCTANVPDIAIVINIYLLIWFKKKNVAYLCFTNTMANIIADQNSPQLFFACVFVVVFVKFYLFEICFQTKLMIFLYCKYEKYRSDNKFIICHCRIHRPLTALKISIQLIFCFYFK